MKSLNEMSRRQRVFVILIAYACFASFSLAAAVVMFTRISVAHGTNSWKEVPAVLDRVEQKAGIDGGELVVAYRYLVNNSDYIGTKISYRVFESSVDHCDLLKKKGGVITAYYNPAQPEQSVIVPGVGLANYLFLFIILFVFAAFTLMFVVFVRDPDLVHVTADNSGWNT